MARTTAPARSPTCTRSPGTRAQPAGCTRRAAVAQPSARTPARRGTSPDEGRDRHYTWSVAVDPDDPGLWSISASTGPFAAHGGGDPQARIYRRRAGEPWRVLGDGLPEPLPAMPYALVAADGRLFAGLADGQIWESGDRGDTWRACTIQGDPITALHALAYAAP